jgi:hypothetical protein
MRTDIIKNDSAQGGVISFFIGAMIATIIALSVAWPVMDASINGNEMAASSAFTFTGNVTCGQLVNVTNAAGVKVTFEFNQTDELSCAPKLGVYDDIVLTRFGNTSAFAATNLTDELNDNASITGTMTATNPSAGKTVLTYNTIGTTGNTVLTEDTVTNGAWDSSRLLDGANSATNNMSSASQTMVDQLPLFLVLVLLMVFIKAVI